MMQTLRTKETFTQTRDPTCAMICLINNSSYNNSSSFLPLSIYSYLNDRRAPKNRRNVKMLRITHRRHRINLSDTSQPLFTAAIHDILLAHVAHHCKHFFSDMIYELVPGKPRSEECICVMVQTSCSSDFLALAFFFRCKMLSNVHRRW